MSKSNNKLCRDFKIVRSGPFGCEYFALVSLRGEQAAVACGVNGQEQSASGDPERLKFIREGFWKFKEDVENYVFSHDWHATVH